MQCGPEGVASNLLEILDYAGLIMQAPGVAETEQRAYNRRAVIGSWVLQLSGGRVRRIEEVMSLICTVSIQEMCVTREMVALWGENGPAIETKLLPAEAKGKLAGCMGKGAFVEETVPLFNKEAWVLRRPIQAVTAALETYEWRENVIGSMAKVMMETARYEPCTVLVAKQCMDTAVAHCRTRLLGILQQKEEEESGKVTKEVARRLCNGIFRAALTTGARR